MELSTRSIVRRLFYCSLLDLLLTFAFIDAQASSNIAVLVKNPLSGRNSESKITVYKNANQSVTFEKATLIGDALGEQRFVFSGSNTIHYGEQENHESKASLILPPNIDVVEKVGIYTIRVSDGHQGEQIRILLLNENTTVIPDVIYMVVQRRGASSLTVSVLRDSSTENLRWRRDGVFCTLSGECTCYSGATCSISDIESSHVYECFTAGRYAKNNHAIMNVIVRQCNVTHWGSDCNGECPRCFNGGVCSDRSGMCQCPPGFSGQHCELVHGENVFGQHGEYRCDTELAVHYNSCRGALICYPDPFGCVCPSGYSGIDCADGCKNSKFGANCLQECHCSMGSTCSRDTGVCSNGICADGWKGVNCQVEDPCNIGVYGELCTLSCSCSHKDCLEVEENCRRGCAIPWTGAACDSNTGEGKLEPMDIVRGNPGFPTTVTCTVTKNPILEDQKKLVLTFPGQSLSVIGHAIHERGYKLTKTWNITLESPGNVECYIRGTDIRRELHLVPAELPAFTSSQSSFVSSDVSSTTIKVSWRGWEEDSDDGDGPIWGYKIQCTGDNETSQASVSESILSYKFNDLSPESVYRFSIAVVREGPGGVGKFNKLTTLKTSCAALHKVSFTSEVTGLISSVTVEWAAWNATTDAEDPRVLGYIPYYKRTSATEWLSAVSDLLVESLDFTFSNLLPGEKYSFSVAAVREGEVGECTKSPELIVLTPCEVPNGPVNVKVKFHGDEEELLGIHWEMPNTHKIRCSSGVSHLTIYYTHTEHPGMEVAENITNVNSTFYTFKVPIEEGTYIFQMSLTTAGGESEKSNPVYFSITSALPLPYIVAIGCTAIAVIVLLGICLVGLIVYRSRSNATGTSENLENLYEAPCEKHDDQIKGEVYNKYHDHCFSSMQQDEYEIPKEESTGDGSLYENANEMEEQECLYTNTSF